MSFLRLTFTDFQRMRIHSFLKSPEFSLSVDNVSISMSRLFFYSFKRVIKGWSNGSVLNSTWCPCRGPRFISHHYTAARNHRHFSSRGCPLLTSAGTRYSHTHVMHRQTCRQSTQMSKKNKPLKISKKNY